uniref:Peptidase M14 domain-containing protein n=1 Tax=Capitella teleta TaxID=283909 RepID=X1Z8H5_CAPTE
MDIQIPPHVFEEFTLELTRHNFNYSVIIDDLQTLLDAEKEESQKRQKRSTWATNGQEVRDLVGEYGDFNEIMRWIEAKQSSHPSLIHLQDIGRSYEGRSMRLVRIGSRGRNKPAIWIDSGIHAREWIAPATSIYIMNELIESYGIDSNVTALMDDFDWYFLPVANPDGYHYSHSMDRFWRKTRSLLRPNWYHQRYRCQGVDLNRNFDFEWRGHCDSMHCRSRNPCDASYAGSQPFSESESIAVANFILRNQGALKMYLSLHSYSQMWLTPWGNSRRPPADYPDLIRVANAAVSALHEVNGTEYKVGSPAVILYAAGGGSYDWAKAIANIKYSYTVELRDTGDYGFVLPRRLVRPVGEETWAGIKAAVEEMKTDTCWVQGVGC